MSEIKVKAGSESHHIPDGWEGTLEEFDRKLLSIFADERRKFAHVEPGVPTGYCKVWCSIDFGDKGVWSLRLDVTRRGDDCNVLEHLIQVQEYYRRKNDKTNYQKYGEVISCLQEAA